MLQGINTPLIYMSTANYFIHDGWFHCHIPYLHNLAYLSKRNKTKQHSIYPSVLQIDKFYTVVKQKLLNWRFGLDSFVGVKDSSPKRQLKKFFFSLQCKTYLQHSIYDIYPSGFLLWASGSFTWLFWFLTTLFPSKIFKENIHEAKKYTFKLSYL